MAPRPTRPLARLLLVLGLAAASTWVPPHPRAGACDPGRFVDVAPMGDLGLSADSPAQPELLSAVWVKPRSRIGCQCGDPCIEEVLIEFRVRSDAPWLRIDGGGVTRYSERAAGSDPGEGLFYYRPGTFPGAVPTGFDISVLDEAGHRSASVPVTVSRDDDPEIR